jgi:periplasmic divalent cation tolerance protein
MILVYITCKDKNEAEKIGKHLMDNSLCACVNIFPNMNSMTFWPPKMGKIEEAKEAVLLIKTVEEKYDEIEKEILEIHSYELPCIFSIKVDKAHKKYSDWLKNEIK